VSQILEDIVADDDYATSVVTRFRSFIKTGDPKFRPVALETVVRNALALFRGTEQRFHVNVETDIAAGLPEVRGDGVQLTQVVLNLLVNGCESMSGLSAPDRCLRIRVARAGDGFLEVQVADQGVGLPADGEKRIFEPFFTTKENGLGLGLAISRFIVGAHGGRLFATENLEGGTTFHLVLPADDASSWK
jgi:two-component system, LuxR family, sensor kinase FixL